VRIVPECKVRDSYGIIGGKKGVIVGSLDSFPNIKLVVIDKELHYISEDNLIIEEEFSRHWAKRLLQCVGTIIPARWRGNNIGD
jgi:hypothetical protein